MADQIERLIEAVKEVGQKLTRLSTYYHPIIMGAGIVSAVSSVIGNMASKYFVGGAAMSSSGGATGSMTNINQLEGSASGISNVPVRNLTNMNQFVGFIAAQSDVSDAAMQTFIISLAGICAARTIVGHAVLEI